MSLFDIDYDILATILTPRQLRNVKHHAWLKILLAPVIFIYNLFTLFRKDNLYTLNHSSQVCYLQAVLNDTFDNDLRRIRIVDSPDEPPIYIYQSAESKPVYIYTSGESQPQPLYTQNETALDGPDFIVEVPHDITFDEVYMKALIDKYRLASKKNYVIQII